MTNCQSTDFRKLTFHSNISLATINFTKAACKKMGMKYPYHHANLSHTMLTYLNDYVSEIEPDTHLIDRFFKGLILFTAKAA